MISAFVQLLLSVGQVRSDVIGELPPEVTANIFRYLDDKSLVSASQVNRRWRNVCQGDPILRRRVRRKLRRERSEHIQAHYNAGIKVTRTNPGMMFGQRNETVTVVTKPVEFEPYGRRNMAPVVKKFKVKKSNKVHPLQKCMKKIDCNNNVKNVRTVLRL